ncbi:Protein ASP-1 protein6, partial [Aphelenchoides avenae]
PVGINHSVTALPLRMASVGGNDAVYVLNVSVGTPAQTLRLMLDNAFANAHVLATNFGQNASTCGTSRDIRRSRFDFNASKTFKGWTSFSSWGESGASPFLPYEEPSCLSSFGYNAKGFDDTVQLADVSLPSIPASVIFNFSASLNPDWTADGFFGIAPPYFDPSYNTIFMLLASFPKRQLSVYYARTELGDGDRVSDGTLTLGGADSVNCDREWVGSYMMNVTDVMGAWVLPFDSISIGDQPLPAGWFLKQASIVSKTSFIGAPKAAVDAVINVTGAEYSFRTDSFQVDCDKRPSLPDLVLKVNAAEYRMPAVDYARRLHPKDKGCMLMMKVGKSDQWTLGTSFFRAYCQLVDYSTNTFSLSKALH